MSANPDMFVMKLRYALGLETPTYRQPQRFGMMLKATVLARNAPLHVFISQPADYRCAIYDLTGREVERLYQGHLETGEHRLPIGASLAPGVYLVRIETGSECLTSKVILAR